MQALVSMGYFFYKNKNGGIWKGTQFSIYLELQKIDKNLNNNK